MVGRDTGESPHQHVRAEAPGGGGGSGDNLRHRDAEGTALSTGPDLLSEQRLVPGLTLTHIFSCAGRGASGLPHLTRLPSAYIREHVWLTTQPIEEPETPAAFQQLLDDLGMDDRIMFSTDYPHWDFDAPDTAIPASVAPEVRRKIMADNARSLYRF